MLDRNVQYLKGVGPKRVRLFERLGIRTVRDLLGYFPREYDDRRVPVKIATVQDGQRVTVAGTVMLADTRRVSSSLAVFSVAVSDGTGTALGVFFRKSNPYHRHDVFGSYKELFTPGRKVYFAGTAECGFGKKQIRVEEFELHDDNARPAQFLAIVPVYPLTEGLSQKALRELMRHAVAEYADAWPEILSPAQLAAEKLMPARGAVREIHFPRDPSAAESARRRLAYDEFFLLETALTLARRGKAEARKPARLEIRRNLLTPFREKLRFEFTPPQKKVINEIFDDMTSDRPMHRLLMGDVGSGKTVVALSAVLLAAENGRQAAFLAPTEILAEQHYITVKNLLEGLPVSVLLLTGSSVSRKSARTEIRRAIAEGESQVIIGTHAMLEQGVTFKNLALIVIDEQHRFGVLQRAALAAKGTMPDVLLMTATPIPRSLALTLYGDMDVSVIDRLPPGRRPIKTVHYPPEQAYGLVKREIEQGRQAYIVYPLVEESDKVELKAAVQEADTLSRSVFAGYRVGLLHGQMKSDEKDGIMRRFRDREFDLLIATSVIEVGIDVPNATVMVIEHAERFGLAALHQLRGRVGRGAYQSWCALIGTPKSEDAKKRIAAMLATTDGFKLAEEDLNLRGPGEFFGTAQHGMPVLKAGNLLRDTTLIQQARAAAKALISADPGLSEPANAVFKEALYGLYRERLKLFKTG